MLGLINTRPEPRGDSLTQRMLRDNIPVITWPLLAITSIETTHLDQPRLGNQGTVVVVTSPSAAEYGLLAAKNRNMDLGLVQWLCVGAATAAVIAKAGYVAKTAPTANSEGVLFSLQLASPLEIWLWRGLGGRELISDAVSTHPSLHFCDWRLYARALPSNCAELAKEFGIADRAHSHAVLISSVQTWQHFVGIVAEQAFTFRLIVLGERVRQTIEQHNKKPLAMIVIADLQSESIAKALKLLNEGEKAIF